MSDRDHEEPSERVSLFSLMMLILTILALLLIARGVLRGSPAPLPRHERAFGPSPFPRHCAVYWHGVRWEGEFGPGGIYRLRSKSGYTYWHGTWRLEGLTLTIREWYGSDREECDVREWEIDMEPNLRRGCFRSTRGTFRLGEP